MNVRTLRVLLLTFCAVDMFLGRNRCYAEPQESGIDVPSNPGAIYDADPEHLWNRLHAAFWLRTTVDGDVFGVDRLDPLLWHRTKSFLLTDPSHTQAVKLLDEFLAGNGESLIEDPQKRAMLQRDLWAVFDWLVEQHRWRERSPEFDEVFGRLATRLAAAVSRLALSREQINALPDNYEQAVQSGEFAPGFREEAPDAMYLPHDLFDATGPWVCVGRALDKRVAPGHIFHHPRSAFLVLLNLPGGRQTTLEHLGRLTGFMPNQVGESLLRFPEGTQVALVRRAMLLDNTARAVVSPLTESVQLRRYYLSTRPDAQHAFEFELRRVRHFAGRAGGLQAVDFDEIRFNTSIGTQGIDLFEESNSISREQRRRLFQEAPRLQGVRTTPIRSCVSCHNKPGILSFLTYAGSDSLLHRSALTEISVNNGLRAAERLNEERYHFGVLTALTRVGVQADAPRAR